MNTIIMPVKLKGINITDRKKNPDGKIYLAYTDGSNDNRDPRRPAGAAYVILDSEGNEIHRASKGFLGKTNNFAEMIAIISAVAWVPEGARITVRSDSQYAINIFSGEWAASANLNLLERYKQVSKGKKVYLEWVRSHSGIYWNEVCDGMARREYERMRSMK